MTVWPAYLAVGAGSALGCSLRYQVSLAMAGIAGPVFPWATLLVNTLGSWLIAAFVAYATRRTAGRVARWQPFLVAGFCGGFTTFSLFGLETLQLLEQGRAGLALAYVLLSVPLWLAGAWSGHRAGHRAAART
ncbi:fluoride efflux transporter FluC [Halomonas sp. C05BenzN]|uniref:fluoride efflux transporter FluC n=1 Tax=Halomonas sp. C05BenzN TaxID=3411041 RepID=UPI003B9584D9